MRGFTVVELVASIVIIAILAAVVGPKFFDNTAFATRGYVDEVAAALRQAQAVAVSSGCDVSITFTAATYQAQQRAASAGALPPCAIAGGWVTPVMRGDGTAVSGTAPNGVTLTPATQLVFDAAGKAVGGAPPAIQIGTFTLSIDAISGLVTVQ